MNLLEIGPEKATEILRKTFADNTIPWEDKQLALDYPDTWREEKRADKARHDAIKDDFVKMIDGLGGHYDD